MNKSCGIDFGTSNSALGIANGGIELIEVENNHKTIPSALFFSAAEKKTLFGREAQQAYMHGNEGRFMRSLKRILGTSLIDQTTVVNGKSLSFKDIIALFIKNLKQDDIDNVVMGKPVHFVDDDTSADKRAENELKQIAETIGFKNIEFQFEPIAAAFAHEQNLSNEKLSLVADIGGGTSDFTIIRLSPDLKNSDDRKNDILANTGVRIGGNDFDKDLSLNNFMPQLGYDSIYGEKNLAVPKTSFHDLSEWSKVNFVYTPKILRDFRNILKESYSPETLRRFINILEHQYGHHLLASIEEAKIELTNNGEYIVDLNYIDKNFEVDIAVKQLNQSIKENVSNILKNVKKCIKLAKIHRDNVELIILTGGSTEIPYIQKVLAKMFPNAHISQENKLSSVALGLAYDAKRKF